MLSFLKRLLENGSDRYPGFAIEALAAAGITIVPSHVVSGLGHKVPSDKLNIAGIGIGGKSFGNLRELESENIVALCDVDWDYAKKAFDKFPKAKKV